MSIDLEESMKKILFINPYIYLPGEKAIKRTFYLFDMMRNMGCDVTFLTSDFNHYEKKERDVVAFYQKFPEYKECVQFVHMPAYNANISFKRFFCNYIGDRNVVDWYKKNGSCYDLVYITWPASYIVRALNGIKSKKTKLILDINDLWPDSMRTVIKNDLLYNLITFPMQFNTKKAFSYANGLIAVSEEYLEKASTENSIATIRKSVYIGAMLEKFDRGVSLYSDSIRKNEDEFWLIYVGTLGKSYDIDTVIKAVAWIEKNTELNVRFKILGQGPTECDLLKLVHSIDTSRVDFMGFMEYEKMAAYLQKSDVCMNCLKPRASQSIINKIADYFASGNPVLNCGPCREMKDLIEKYNTGLNYDAENVESCVQAILKIVNKDLDVERIGENSRKLAEEKFDRYKTHMELISILETM